MAEQRFRVLLVDDEPDFVEALAARMETRGWVVETAGSGPEALEKAENPEFDAILLDLSMPGMDGIETLRRILELDPLHQVIIVTGQATLEKGMEAIQAGALDVLEKPVPLAVLMDKVQEAARRKRRMAETRPAPTREKAKPKRARAVPVLHRVFPFLAWIKECRGEALRADLLSGLTVALVLIPQSMAYAQLAGLPAYYGLYAAFLPPTIAALFGSSRQLATGPVAVVSLMTSAALEPIATAGSKEYVAYAILLALLVGLFQLALGLLRLGLVVNFLSHPVVNGFTNAAALIIATSQLASVFGVEVEKGEHQYETVWRVLQEAARSTHWPTLGMAALAFAIMIGLKKVNPRIPNVLVAVAVTTLLAWGFHFSKRLEVPLSSLPAGEVQDRIRAFNEAVSERQEMEGFRTAMNKRLENLFKPGQKVCLGCHEQRSAKRFEEAARGEAGETPPGDVLLLHHRAELVDARIGELKEEEEGLRKELRAFAFEREVPAGETLFLKGHVPPGARGDGGRWKLKVGNKPLDVKAVALSGGGAVVGKIPKGLPKPSVPSFRLSVALKLLPVAMIISILGFMEAISIAKAMASKTHHRLDPNQELVGQGLANTVGSLFQGYAVSGSFSRSAVNFQSGAVTGLSSAFSSVVVVVTLFFFTPLLFYLPQATLAAIIMMAVVGLLNVKGFVHAWKAQWFDGFTAIVTFAVTLYLAPELEWGILSGVVLSLGAYLYRTMHPHVAELSLHSDGSLRDAERHALKLCEHIAAIRFDGPLNFASCTYLEDEILGRVTEMPKLRHVLIVAHGINELDASGEEMLDKIVHRLRAGGIRVSFSGLKDNVIDVLCRTHLYEKIGEEHMYATQLIAIQQIHEVAHIGSGEKRCPLVQAVAASRAASSRRRGTGVEESRGT